MEIHLSNGDYLIGAMQSMDYENLFFSSGFRKNLKLQFDSLSHLYFLPGTHQVLFDAFTDYKSWKKVTVSHGGKSKEIYFQFSLEAQGPHYPKSML